MRSLWAICEAERQLPRAWRETSELATLAASARQQVAETPVAKPAEGSDPAVVEAIKQSGVEVVSWKQVREMNGKKVAAGN